MKAIATLDENSLLAKHHMLHSHQIDLKLLTGHRRGDKDRFLKFDIPREIETL